MPFVFNPLTGNLDSVGDPTAVHLAGTETIIGAKTFEAVTTIDGDAGTKSATAATGALKIEGTTDVNYVDIWGASSNLLRATDTRASSANNGGGATWGNNDGAALASGDRLGFNLFFGYDGVTTRNGASFSAYAASGWASNSYPTYMVIDTAKTSSRVENIRFGGAGTAGVTINETGADQDFRVEGDTDTNLIFGDASTDRVGIGNNAPTQKLDVTGNIAVSGTVDGRDIATDGSKLDGIEAGATADQTAADVPFTSTTFDSYGVTPATNVQEASDSLVAAMTAAFGDVYAYIPTAHNQLTDLTADDHTQYPLLAGRAGGQTISGSSAEDEHLTLRANAATFNTNSNTGRIKWTDQVVNEGGFTISHDNGGVFKLWEYYGHRYTGTVTLQSAANIGTYASILNDATFVWDTAQVFSSVQLFDARPTIEPTLSANMTDNTSNYRMFFALPTIKPNITTAATWTGTAYGAYVASPQIGIKTGSHASAAVVMPRMYSYVSAGIAVGTQTTVTDMSHLWVQNATSLGTITRQIGLDIEALSAGVTNIGIRLAKANTYTIQLSDTGGTAAGGITFGTDTNLYRSAANVLKTDDKLLVTGELELDGALNHDGTTVGFYGTAPATQSTGWSATNVTTDKTFDANATTIDELADVVGTLIDTLKTMGVIGA